MFTALLTELPSLLVDVLTFGLLITQVERGFRKPVGDPRSPADPLPAFGQSQPG